MVEMMDVIGKQQEFPYLDDLIAASNRYNGHLRQIEEALTALREVGLTIRLKKCESSMREVKFLGFKLSKDGTISAAEKCA